MLLHQVGQLEFYTASKTFHKMKTEVIVAIVSLVVSLPPALYALHTWYLRRSLVTCEYLQDVRVPKG